MGDAVRRNREVEEDKQITEPQASAETGGVATSASRKTCLLQRPLNRAPDVRRSAHPRVSAARGQVGEWRVWCVPQTRSTRLHSTLSTSIRLRKAPRRQAASRRYRLPGGYRR